MFGRLKGIPPQYLYPGMVVCLLMIPVAIDGYIIYRTSQDESFSVEEDYYRKAVEWDAEMAQRRQNLDLGWTVDVKVEGTGAQRVLHVALKTQDGELIKDAEVTVVTFHNARARHKVSTDLAPGDTGYAAAVDMTKPGQWVVRLTATRGDKTFTSRKRLTIGEA